MKVVLVILACSYLNPIQVENCKMEYVHGLDADRCRVVAEKLSAVLNDRYPVDLGCMVIGEGS
jgi:hypothetical protein